METNESALPDAAGVRVQVSRSAEEQAFSFRERYGDTTMMGLEQDSPFDATALRVAAHPVSISLPASPSRFNVARTEEEFPPRRAGAAIVPEDGSTRMMSLPPRPPPPMVSVAFERVEKVMFRSQPIPAAASALPNAGNCQFLVAGDDSMSRGSGARMGGRSSRTPRDTSYDSFKTWSGKLEKQLATHLRGVRPPPPQQLEALLRGAGRPRTRQATVVGGAGAAVGQDVAVPSPVPGVGVRHVPGHEQPGDPVEEHRDLGVDAVPAHHGAGEPGAVVRVRGAHVLRVGAVRVQGGLLLRGGASRVLPPDPRQLLLRAVDRVPVPGHRRAGAGGREPAALAVVRAHGAHRVPGAEDLRAVDLRRAEAAVQGGEPVEPPVRRRQLRGRAAGGHHGPEGGPHLLLRRRAGALHRAVRDAVPEAAHERDAAQGPPPGLLPLRGRAQRRLPRLGKDHRRVRVRLPDRLLHRHVPLRLPGCADQHVQRVQVLAGVVGVHVPDDERGHRGDTLLVGGEERLHAGHVHRAHRGGHAHGDHALPHHAAARRRAPRPLPQRHRHRHHGAQAQAHHQRRPQRAAPRQGGRRRPLQGPRGRREDGILNRDDADIEPRTLARALARHHVATKETGQLGAW